MIAVDRVPHRLERAASRGAIAVNFDDEDVIARVQELTDGRGADVCVEAVGFRYVKSLHHRIQKTLKLETDSIDALNECIRACRKYGWVSIVGDFIGFANQYPIGAFMEKGLQAGSGQVHVQRYWADLLGIIERGEFDPTFVSWSATGGRSSAPPRRTRCSTARRTTPSGWSSQPERVQDLRW